MSEFAPYLTSIHFLPYPELRNCWQEAERLGYPQAWMMDDVIAGVGAEHTDPADDAWSNLAGLAEATARIKLGPLLTPIMRRPAPLLAKTISLVDRISEGRLEVALGPGNPWEQRQFQVWGQNYPTQTEQFRRLREDVQVLRLLFSQNRPSFKGEFYDFRASVNAPKPLQPGGPPLWIGVLDGRRVMPRLAAEFADRINVTVGDDEELKRTLDIIAECCARLGRDSSSIKKNRIVSVHVTDKVLEIDDVIDDLAPKVKLDPVEFRTYLLWLRRIWGPKDYCIEQLSKTFEMGIDQVVMDFHGLDERGKAAGYSEQNVLENLQSVAEQIVPAFS